MTLRWLKYSQHRAAWNMAVDEAILQAHLEGSSPPTIRFYGWTPSAVSLGYAQKIDETTIQRIQARGFDVVRRPTGGRAVLHHGDLTYSYVGSAVDLGSSVSASYMAICAGLLEGLKLLGVDAEIGRGNRPYNRFQDCFQTTTTADLQVNGLKVIGSAQLRRKHAVLQHGSILLQQEQKLLPELLSESVGSDTNGDTTTKNRHCSLFDLIDTRSICEVEKSLVEGFEVSTGNDVVAGELTELEMDLAREYAANYATLAYFKS